MKSPWWGKEKRLEREATVFNLLAVTLPETLLLLQEGGELTADRIIASLVFGRDPTDVEQRFAALVAGYLNLVIQQSDLVSGDNATDGDGAAMTAG